MKGAWTSGLGLTLGLLVGTGRADDVVWRAVKGSAQTPPPPAPIQMPVEPEVPQPSQPTSTVVNAARLSILLNQMDRPTPIEPVADVSVVRASAGDIWVRVRAQKPSDDAAPTNATPMVPLPPGAVVSIPAAAGCSDCQNGVGVPIVGEWGAVPERQAPLFLVSAEFLLWWTKGANGPPLLVGQVPGTTSFTQLLTYSDLDERERYGVRVSGVYWLDNCASYGIDGRIFYTGQRTSTYAIDSQSGLNLFRPFTPANAPVVINGVVLPPPDAEAVNAPGQRGAFTATNRSEFWGAELNYRDNVLCGCGFRADLLAGFRYLSLDEDLTITEDITLTAPNPLFPSDRAGTRQLVFDKFSTENDFYGGQLGAAVQFRRDRWTLDVRGTVALGVTQQRLTIEGGQTRSPQFDANGNLLPGLVFVGDGGLLALNSNIGSRTRDVFSVAPEIGVNLGYQVTDHIRLFGGYNFLYWSNVIRPGDQIDTVLDVTRIPRFVPPGLFTPVNPPRPAATFNSTDFWAQGFSVGLEYRW